MRGFKWHRYKGRPSAKNIERDFPHAVDIAVPLGGFGKTPCISGIANAVSRRIKVAANARKARILSAGVSLVRKWLPTSPLSSPAPS